MNIPEDYEILESALKHGISVAEISYVLDWSNPTQRYYDLHDDEFGNSQDMVVAHTGTRPWPIEVGLSYRKEVTVVFHANRASGEYLERYENEK
jgi:hypothetical protein